MAAGVASFRAGSTIQSAVLITSGVLDDDHRVALVDQLMQRVE